MHPTPLGFLICSLLRAGAAAEGDPTTAQVDQIFAEWDNPETPGCALAVIKDGKIVYKRGFGLANLEYGVRNKPSTVFHIASTSKQFTAFAIVLLAQEGKLSLDEDVRKYLPELHDFGNPITIRHLLHHTSGLRDQWNLVSLAGWRMEDVITEQDILSLVWRQRELNFPPGTEYLYCNTGYTLLGLIVKRISGQSLKEFCQERIFAPLGMKSTHFHDDHREIVKNRAYSYSPRSGGGFQQSVLSYANVGATSLFTTVEDLARWDRNCYDGRVGGTAVLAQMLTRGKLNDGKELEYAAGLVVGEYRGLRTVEHGGGDAGFRCTLLRFPDEQFSVILLANAASFNPGGMARKVADLYLADRLQPEPEGAGHKAVAQRTEIKIDPALYDAYAGEYELSPTFILAFTKENDRLFSRATGQGKVEIFSSSETEFFARAVDAQFTFHRTLDGAATQVILHQGGQDRPAKRIQRTPLTPEQLAEYVGDYYSDELGVIYTVSVLDGKLMLRHAKGQLELEGLGADVFAAPFPIGVMRSNRDAANRLTGFTIDNGRIRNLRFAKTELKSAQ